MRTFLHSVNSAVIIQLAAVVSNKVTGVAGEIMSRPVLVIHAIVISISVRCLFKVHIVLLSRGIWDDSVLH